MDIEFDPRKASANLRNHRVAFSEAETCLLDPLALVREDQDAEGEARRAGRLVKPWAAADGGLYATRRRFDTPDFSPPVNRQRG